MGAIKFLRYKTLGIDPRRAKYIYALLFWVLLLPFIVGWHWLTVDPYTQYYYELSPWILVPFWVLALVGVSFSKWIRKDPWQRKYNLYKYLNSLTFQRLLHGVLQGSMSVCAVILCAQALDSVLEHRNGFIETGILVADIIVLTSICRLLIRAIVPNKNSNDWQLLEFFKESLQHGLIPLCMVGGTFLITLYSADAWHALSESGWFELLVIATWVTCFSFYLTANALPISRGCKNELGVREICRVLVLTIITLFAFGVIAINLVPSDVALNWMGSEPALSCGQKFYTGSEMTLCLNGAYLLTLFKLCLLISTLTVVTAAGSIHKHNIEMIKVDA